ncbi:RNA-directed DNA polymerase [Bradyrhizobium zhanjiangense]|uniref:RNA-directed DNA polymerase n=1 Tax=Bradyrhizobium zhanjiangense TaxID=1325107 RepID=A0ABY0DA75_9BRAD|nr:RNA-directed DNA polymerase [Bradyrhizobium zhanjiangense]RXG85064.1 RNA-directed DNA polymerase [Bradyrhizobium zhanjiangense]
MISEASVRRAINHLGAFGDTDLFPRLPEMRCFLERPGTTAKDCESLNIGQYAPVGAVETLTPKSWLGFRIAHQLAAADNVIYLASLLDCAPNLEAARLPKEGNEAFAYRFAEGESLRIFEAARGFHQWLAYLSEFGGPENPFAEDRPAILTDISDFYQRIYFHRIENVLQDAGCPKGPSDLVKKIIKTSRARQSYGLPVGSTASRLLAECLLNDTDMLLKNMGVKFTRYVDDFRIEVPAGVEAHSILCRLAEHLMVTEGLSLNVTKTKMTSVKEIRRSSKGRLQDVFTSAEMERMKALITLNYGEEDEPKDEDMIANPLISAEFLLDRLDEIGDKKGIDLSVFKAVLRALRFLPGIDAMRLLEKHADLLYYVPREFCLVLSAASKQEGFPVQSVKARVRELLAMSPYADLAYVRSWLLYLFVDGSLPVSLADWQFYDFNRSVIERRSHFFFRGLANDRPFFRALKTQLGSLSEWDKPAALMAGMCLPFDEYKHWLADAARQINSPFAATYTAWLRDNHGKLGQLLSEPHEPVCTDL